MAGGFSPGDIYNFIKEIDFPASKQDLILAAEEHDAPQQVIDKLHDLPDREYESVADVVKEAVV